MMKTETGPIPVAETYLVKILLPTLVGGLGILAAFIVCCVHSTGKWKVRKDVILYVIEGSYLLYTGALICIGVMNNGDYYDSSKNEGPGGPGNVGIEYRQWVNQLASTYTAPYIPLLFTPIP